MNIENRKNFIKLNQKINLFEKIYSKSQFFGIFYFKQEDIYHIYIFPSFEDMCLRKPGIRDLESINKTFILDIRYLYEKPTLLECLYCDYYIINNQYEHMYEKLLKFNREAFKKEKINNDYLTKIIWTNLNNNSNTINFLKNLSDAEKLALQGIIQTIGDEGVFSQSKVASKVGISRLTMTNLVSKLKQFNMVISENMGSRGTYIKFIDNIILFI